MIVEMCMSRDVETIPPEASLFDRLWNSGRAVVNVLRNTP